MCMLKNLFTQNNERCILANHFCVPDPNSHSSITMDPNAAANQNLAMQQNWNQWQAYQQQLAQWQAQYGEQVNIYSIYNLYKGMNDLRTLLYFSINGK